jgi:hypothetical protein
VESSNSSGTIGLVFAEMQARSYCSRKVAITRTGYPIASNSAAFSLTCSRERKAKAAKRITLSSGLRPCASSKASSAKTGKCAVVFPMPSTETIMFIGPWSRVFLIMLASFCRYIPTSSERGRLTLPRKAGQFGFITKEVRFGYRSGHSCRKVDTKSLSKEAA